MPSQVIGGAPGELPMMAHFQLPPGRHRFRFTSLSSAGDIVDRWIQAQAVPDLDKPPLVLATPKLLRARNMIVAIDDPAAGPLKLAGNPIKLSDFPDPPSRPPAPALDADRAAILSELDAFEPPTTPDRRR